MRHRAERGTRREQNKPAGSKQRAQSRQVLGHCLPFVPVAARSLSCGSSRRQSQRAEKGQEDRHRDARDNVHDYDRPPAEHCQQCSDRKRSKRIADVTAHAVQRQHQPFALGEALGQGGNRRWVPQIIADADQRDAEQKQPVAVSKSHQQVRHTDPEQGNRHQQPLLAHGIDERATGYVGDRAGDVLAGHDEPDLAIAEIELATDDRQQQVEGRRVPVRQAMADRDQPYVAKGLVRSSVGCGSDGGHLFTRPIA